MNYLVKRPSREVFILLVYVGPDEFKYCYTDQSTFTGHIGDLHDFVSIASSRYHAIVTPTTASTIDEVRIAHPELLI